MLDWVRSIDWGTVVLTFGASIWFEEILRDASKKSWAWVILDGAIFLWVLSALIQNWVKAIYGIG